MLLSHARVLGHVTPRNPLKIAKNDHFWPKIATLGILAFGHNLDLDHPECSKCIRGTHFMGTNSNRSNIGKT